MSFRALLLATILALGACDLRPADFSRLEVSAERFHTRWSTRLAEVQAAHQALVNRLQQQPVDAVGYADAKLQLDSIGKNIGELLSTKLPETEAEIRTRIDQKQQHLAEEALRHGGEDFASEVTEASNNLEVQRVVLEEIEKQAAAKQEERKGQDLSLTGAVADIVAPAFARQKGESDVLGVNFKPNTAELDFAGDVTKAALMRLIALAAACDGIRLDLTAHTAKDGDAQVNQRVSTAQAEAVRQYLIASGVTAEKIASVSGVGSARPAVPEPAVGSAEEAAMSTEDLAKIRGRNRRISVTVVEPCPAANPA